MIHAALILAMLGSTDITVEDRAGSSTKGSLVELTADGISFVSGDETQTVEASGLAKLNFGNPATKAPESSLVQLRDGSQLTATSITVTDGEATITTASGISQSIPTDKIDYALLQPTNEGLDAARAEIFERRPVGDVVIIRRPSEKLDYVDGVFGDISSESVRFQFDDEWIDVRRGKVDSIWYYSATPDTQPKSRCDVKLIDDSNLKAASLQLDDNKVLVRTTGGLDLSLPLSTVREIIFASSTAIPLSSLSPERVERTPSLEIAALSRDLSDLGVDDLFAPRVDESFIGSGQLRLMGKGGVLTEHRQGIALHSRTELTYRLAGEYRRLTALAGLDPASRLSGLVELVIHGDDQELYRKELQAEQSAVELDLDLSGVNRLRILVDYGDNSGVADRVNICDARLLK